MVLKGVQILEVVDEGRFLFILKGIDVHSYSCSEGSRSRISVKRLTISRDTKHELMVSQKGV